MYDNYVMCSLCNVIFETAVIRRCRLLFDIALEKPIGKLSHGNGAWGLGSPRIEVVDLGVGVESPFGAISHAQS